MSVVEVRSVQFSYNGQSQQTEAIIEESYREVKVTTFNRKVTIGF